MRIHWFSFTVHTNEEHGRALWKKHFFNTLGDLVSTERKGRGFEGIDVALNEAKFYYNPIQPKKKTDDDPEPVKREYYHIEIPGSACDCCIPTLFQEVFDDLQASGLRWSVKRVDMAWDEVPFSPVEFCKAVMAGHAVTLAKRESLRMVQSPFEIRQDGSCYGCDTCYLGSMGGGRSAKGSGEGSQRFLRVYNERGGTRLEFVVRDERAHVVALDLFSFQYSDWDRVGREHLVQYVRFSEEFSQWHDFIAGAQSADIKISSARVLSLSRMTDWFERQVMVAMSVWFEVWGEHVAMKKFRDMMSLAEGRDRSRYSAVLQLAGG